jgi:two-component system, cell cycle sensor histidine kinase and response regulator CckA
MLEDNRALRASDELLAAQNLVLEMIGSDAPLDAVLGAVTAFVDQQEPSGRCLILLLDPDGNSLRPAASSKLPRSFTRALRVDPRAGACGAAAHRRERVIVRDVAIDPLYEHSSEPFREHGLRSCWSNPILSQDGAVLGVLAVYHDRPHVPEEREIGVVESASRLARVAIQRSKMEPQSRAGQEQFRSLIENTSDIISILDVNGVIRYMSPSLERVLGFLPAELVGTSGFDCFHPDDLDRARRAFQQALRQPGTLRPLEQRFRHKNGSWRVIETIANNQVNDPAIRGIIITGHDITDRKRAEEALVSSQERYRELFENANDIVYTHDLTGTLTSLNKAAEILIGYSREEALGKNIAAIVAPEHIALAREMLDRKIGGEAKTTYELDVVTKNGDRIPLEVSTRLIFRMGKPVAVQGIARDVAVRRRFESHLLQSHKMEAIGRLAGGVAHDFNNLLTVITGYSQWMLDDLPPDSPLCESASEILMAANRAASLTNQLLAFSRNQVIQPIIVDLNSLVAELDQMLRRVIGEDIELVTATSPDLGLVRADPGQIEQVILNLVVNARDAMPGGGRLILETANANIGPDDARAPIDCPAGPYVTLIVSDSGCGFDERIKAHIFEPFFTTKEKGRGTGLGLSTVYGIIKQGGGYIRVESQPGAGAVFRIFFPRVADGELPSGIPERRSRSTGTETILLVEDEAAVRRIVREMLLRLGYTILEASDGRAAQKIVVEYEKPIHLLLTDVVMPELGGRELAQILKTFRPELKVMFMSGYTDDAIVKQGVLEPGAAYLQKPFTPDALAGKIREALDGY